MRTSLLIITLLTACGTGTSDPGSEVPPASLSLSGLDEMAAAIERDVAEVDEAFCDAGGGDPMANCYVGIATADQSEAETVVCGDVVAVIEEWTSGSVTIVTFDSRDDQTIGIAEC